MKIYTDAFALDIMGKYKILIKFVVLIRNDFFNDRTGLRKSAFPIKLAGIMMGSQENLAGTGSEDEETGNGCELRDLWRRRSRRNSLSTNHSTNSMDRRSLSINPSTDRRSTSTNATPFGATGTLGAFINDVTELREVRWHNLCEVFMILFYLFVNL